jgi:hypothetical protein
MHDDGESATTRSDSDTMARRLGELEREVARLTQGDAGSLARRVQELEAQLQELTAPLPTTVGRATASASLPTAPTRATPPRSGSVPTPATGIAAPPTSEPPQPSDAPVDRRRLIGRAGTVALGAVLGGTAISVASASPAAAASGTFDSSTSEPALTATTSGTGPAIRAVSTASAAALVVEGAATFDDEVRIGMSDSAPKPGIALWTEGTGAGVFASGAAWGVHGASEGVGVFGHGGNGYGMLAAGAAAQLLLSGPGSGYPDMVPPRTRTDEHEAGEIYLDDAQSLWLCTAAGTPGTWVRITGAGTAGPLSMLPAPVRVYDTRPGAAPTAVGPKTPLATAVPRTGIALTANGSTVPTDATAAIVSITVTNTTGGSPAGPAYLGLYADGASYAGTSNLNWTAPGSTIAVTTTTAVGPGATIAAFASHPTDLIIDVIAYHR